MQVESALGQFTLDLIEDLKDLRSGKIKLPEARARAMLAREVLRAVSLQLQSQTFLSDRALPAPKDVKEEASDD